jgi:hypothetical protein
MNTYKMQIFDSRNTCIFKTIETISFHAALVAGKTLSRLSVYPVVVEDESKKEWIQFNKGKVYSWSYNLGMEVPKV